jgi:hypothetical protein
VPQQSYTQGMLGVYELNKVDLLKDIFIWGYERSASRYASVRQSLGEPDPFRLRHRAALRTLVGGVVRGRMDKKDAAAHVAAWAGDRRVARQKYSNATRAWRISRSGSSRT